MVICSSGMEGEKGVVAVIGTGPRSTYARRRMLRASLMQADRRYGLLPIKGCQSWGREWYCSPLQIIRA